MIFDDWPWRCWCEKRPKAQALRFGNQTLNWRQLCQKIDRLATGFAYQQLHTGSGVLLRAYNHPKTLLAWLALLQCGARVLPVNPQLPYNLTAKLLPQFSLRFALLLASGPIFSGLRVLRLKEIEGTFASPWQADRLATMTLTSGSGGLPKAAVHTPSAHLASAEGLLALIPYSEVDDWLLSLPLFHISGQGILWRWLFAGARMTICAHQPQMQVILEGCTHASFVPTQLWRLLNNNTPLSLKSVLLGGTEITVALAEKLRTRGIRTFCSYGLTEFASTVCAKETDGQQDVGYPLSGRKICIVDGEIWLRAASQASGYWRNGALIPLINTQGWFATRDRGELRDGRLTVIGRMDNLFFCGGEGIQPEEVEQVISQHPLIKQVYVVPIDDCEYGQRPVAVIEAREGLVLKSLQNWVEDKLASFQQPIHWLILPKIAKTGGIKISRQVLIEWVNEILRC